MNKTKSGKIAVICVIMFLFAGMPVFSDAPMVEDLTKALIKIGYAQSQPRRGSSHYTFRKAQRPPITIPKDYPVNTAYVELVRNAVSEYESEVSDNE